MSLRESIDAILGDASLDDDADARSSSRIEELEGLVDIFGWAPVQLEMLQIMASESDDYCRVAAGFFWGAAQDQRPIDGDRLIAHLCLRFPQGDNLAWSITSKLKGLDYASDYDPLQDPGVVGNLEALRARPR
jgi:hypothetical protein